MRFLTLFLKIFGGLLLGLVSIFLITREAVIWWTTNSLSRQVSYLQRTTQWNNLSNICLERTSEPAIRLQLRFLDDQRYQLEVACADERYEKFQETKSLMWGVIKNGGWAGLAVDPESREVSGQISFDFFGRSKTLYAENGKLRSRNDQAAELSSLLISSCQAHSLTCCQADLQAGLGEQLVEGVNDCPDTCFSSCLLRPKVLMFQTDPRLEPTNRRLVLDKNSSFVLFNYTIEENDNPLEKVVLDFGDGTKEELPPDIFGQVTKEYQCSQDECHYFAKLTAYDNAGFDSAPSRTDQIEIVLK